MYHELSKKEKKIARIFIDKGLDTAFKEGLENCAAVINDWQKRKFNSNDEAYHKLYKVISNKDYQIPTACWKSAVRAARRPCQSGCRSCRPWLLR